MGLLSHCNSTEGGNYLIQWSLAGDLEDLLFSQNKYFSVTDGPIERRTPEAFACEGTENEMRCLCKMDQSCVISSCL